MIEGALQLALREDERRIERGFPGLQASSERAQQLSLHLGVHPDRARVACVAFNALALDTRRILFALLLERRSPDHCLAAGWARSRAHLSRELRRAIEALHGPRERGPNSRPSNLT